jgi:glutamate dehydrogenase/leucine dehydrogenase
MAWIMDTFSMTQGYSTLGVVTGKPIPLGGSQGRNEATAEGCFVAIEEAAKRMRMPLKGRTAAVQGYGNAGAHVARFLDEAGVRVVALSDSKGGIYEKKGLRLELVNGAKEKKGSVTAARGEKISNAELLELPCDVPVLAATENQVTAANAGLLQTKLVAEGANGPTSLEGDEILGERGIPVLPDILTNAGGVTVSYFEWVQDLGRLFWTRNEIRARLADKLIDAFDRVWALSTEQDMTLRAAALVAGIREVAAAMESRGFYP